jgi:hypothetical protein
VVVLEAAVLFEANWTSLVDEIWVTVATLSISQSILQSLLKETSGVTFADTAEEVAEALKGFVDLASKSLDGGLPKIERDLRPYTRRESARQLAILPEVATAETLPGIRRND